MDPFVIIPAFSGAIILGIAIRQVRAERRRAKLRAAQREEAAKLYAEHLDKFQSRMLHDPKSGVSKAGAATLSVGDGDVQNAMYATYAATQLADSTAPDADAPTFAVNPFAAGGGDGGGGGASASWGDTSGSSCDTSSSSYDSGSSSSDGGSCSSDSGGGSGSSD